ncbi:MAG: hypothetical protein DYG89_39345 [Caldilinea sp. CFX5]|nr:hypothetical protein [Caldilinea sp. CFX5]
MFTKLVAIMVAAVSMITAVAFGSVFAESPTNSIQVASELYTVEEKNGNLRVNVQVDLESKAERERYAEQQRQYASELARTANGSIPVQVTFKRPVSAEELQTMSKEFGLLVELLTLEMRDAQNNLHTAVVLVDDLSTFELAKLPTAPEGYTLKPMGVMVVRGTMAASKVGDLAHDERVYLPDVMPYLLTVELAKQYRNISTEQIQVDVPSPHWNLSLERGGAEQTNTKLYLPLVNK